MEGEVGAERVGGKRLKILFDLSVAADGYSGIPYDTRLNFSMLRQSPAVETSGLLYPLGQWSPSRLTRAMPDAVSEIASILHAVAYPDGPVPAGPLRALLRRTRVLRDWAPRRPHPIMEIPRWLNTDAIWRLLFQKSLPPCDRARLLEGRFFVTDFSLGGLTARSRTLPFLADKRLAVGDHDVLWLPMPRPIAVARGVTKVVRYHDSIPLTQPDTVAHSFAPVDHYRAMKSCGGDSLFVCNSPFSRASLLNVIPESEDTSLVIPCAVQSWTPETQGLSIEDILARRISFRSLAGPGGSREPPPPFPGGRAGRFRYVLAVSTFEPRKNLGTTIQAWERLRVRQGIDIKLVLVANDGWGGNAAVLDTMSTHVKAGNLIHLRGLGRDELRVVYENAELCASLPYDEGFGLSPLEALQAKIPVVASDIPVLRWTLAEAALFADPYDCAAIVGQMERLLDTPENAGLRHSVQAAGPAQLGRFSTSAVRSAWEEFFGDPFVRMRERSMAARSKKGDPGKAPGAS